MDIDPWSCVCMDCIGYQKEIAALRIELDELPQERDDFCARLNEIDGGLVDTLRISEEFWIEKANTLRAECDALHNEIAAIHERQVDAAKTPEKNEL